MKTIATTLLLTVLVSSSAMADRVGYIRHDANRIEQVREIEEDGRKVYVVTVMPSGATYRTTEPPPGTVWR